jgi:hypothetical protein
MHKHLFASSIFALSLGLAIVACGGKPKQAEAPDALADKGADMQTGAEGNGGDVKAKEGEKSGEEQMHEKCCGQCKEGLAKDRTGAKAEAIPCADFTDTLDPFCLEHFRGRKTMAAQCK